MSHSETYHSPTATEMMLQAALSQKLTINASGELWIPSTV